jgi:hypothetical protein
MWVYEALLPFRGDFMAGRLRYSNSELTEIVEETLMPGIRDRGEIRVTFSGILAGEGSSS